MLFPLKRLTYLYKALGDATRLRIVNLLRVRSLYVGDLQEVLGLSQPVVSSQLAILRAANLVRTRRQGARVRYSLSRAPVLNYPLRKFLSEIVPIFPELQTDVRRLAEIKGDSVQKSEESSSISESGRPRGSPCHDLDPSGQAGKGPVSRPLDARS